MTEETFSKTGPCIGGRVSPKLRTKGQGDRVDTERAVLGDNRNIFIRRVKFLTVEIAGVPGPMFRLDTNPVESCAIRILRDCSASLPASSGFPYQRLGWPSVGGWDTFLEQKHEHTNRDLSKYMSIDAKRSPTDLRCVSSGQN